MPAYGKVKVDTITYDLSGTATDVSVADIATKASPTFTGTINAANLILSGDLTVNGTTTTIDTTTLQVEDKNIEIGKVSSPSDTTADGGGWTLKGATDKTFNWVNSTDAWTSSEHIALGDNKKLLLGTGSDLEIYHSGSHSNIKDAGTGQLNLWSNTFQFYNAAGNKTSMKIVEDAQVELYHDNSKKLETTTNGIQVTGRLRFDSDNYLDCNNTADTLEIFLGGGQVGEFGTGFLKLLDDKKLQIGTASDIEIYHDGSHSRINATDGGDGRLIISGRDGSAGDIGLQLNAEDSKEAIFCKVDGAVELFYNSSKKFETTTAGVTVTGTVSDSKGDLRKIIQNTQGSAYTLVAADAGKHILASGNITIPNSIFSAGDGVVIVNNTSGDLTITSGITNLYLGTDGSTGNKTLASRCTCTVLFTSGTAGYISGGGLS